MLNPETLLSSDQDEILLNRAGPATCAFLASLGYKKDLSTILVPFKSWRYAEVHALSRLFCPELSSGGPAVEKPLWESPMLGFPALRSPTDKEGWCNRMAAIYALSQGKPRIIVASLQALLLRYMHLDFFKDKILDLGIGQDYSPDLILEAAIEWGYERSPMVTQPGEITRRGDILDIFPAGYRKPCRLEFFGDTIDGMRLFDGETQRSLQDISEITIIPASPWIQDKKSIDLALKRVTKLKTEGKLGENDAYSIKKQLEEHGTGPLPGILHEKSTLLEDWLHGGRIWFLPGKLDGAEALEAEAAAFGEILEDETASVTQPARLALRHVPGSEPWLGGKAVYAEPLRIGIEERGLNLPERDFSTFAELFPDPDARDRPWQTFVAAINQKKDQRRQIIFSFSSERNRSKFLKLAEQDGVFPLLRYSLEEKGLYALVSSFRTGADLEWNNTIVLGEDILFPRADRRERSASRAFKGLDSFAEINRGDLVVHRDYGIGRYAGLHHLAVNGAENDFLLLEYQNDDKLYIPVDRLGLIQRFKGPEGAIPPLDKLGGQGWSLGKEKARKAIEKIAADLIEMYAYRKVAKGFKYHQPDEMYHEFEATFGFEETPDQARAIQDVLDDMAKDEPMDRLVCGDVGFGKTEVALRAAFRAAQEGRQVALLCPTTVLAEQHYQTFRSRLAGFPVNVGLLSRFVPKAQQKEVLKGCANGQIDILIGTHRILSSDVRLPNLALLILDEEQRFGVRHKDKLKAMKKNVDVLTLTATPIPRTLQLSMSGIRDLSIIETAPVERKPVASAVLHRDDETLRKIIRRELDRKGQVFWVYNRVHDLEKVTEYVKKLVPEARVGMAHGQMAETALEKTMRDFWHGDIDVLVSTSIVESGLDFPNANTLIVDQAQMLGLGQLYQLRGRVGRSDKQAYAFFIVPDSRKLNEAAEERLRVILNMDYLGAGFQVAMEDLRMRGAGNILGEAQSGHITRVGLDMFLEMLEEEVARQKGQPLAETPDTEINLGVPAHIPETYITDGRERLRYYKLLTSATSGAARESAILDIRDRYGPLPAELKNFIAVLDFKELLGSLQVERADIFPNSIKMVWPESQTAISPEAVARVVGENGNIKLLPPSTLTFAMPDAAGLEDVFAAAKEWLESMKAA